MWRYPPRPHIRYILLEPFHFLAGDQLVVPRWVTHISYHYKNTIEGTGENKTNEQTRTICLGLTQEQKGSMQHYISDSIYGLMLAWITSENSTKQLECRHLYSISFTVLDPISCCLASLLGCPLSTASVRVPSPTALSSFSQPTLFFRPLPGRGEISSPKTLCLVSRQNRQRNRLLGGPPT